MWLKIKEQDVMDALNHYQNLERVLQSRLYTNMDPKKSIELGMEIATVRGANVAAKKMFSQMVKLEEKE